MEIIKIYTTPYCGYCQAAKKLLESKGLKFEEISLAEDHKLRERLSQENNGYRTVPMIFIDGNFIGGYTELVRAI